MLKPSHVRKLKLQSAHALVAEIDKLLDEANAFLTSNKVPDGVRWAALGDLECNLCYFIAGVGGESKSGVVYTSPRHCAQARGVYMICIVSKC